MIQNLLKYLAIGIEFLFIFLGFLSTTIILHETYHLLDLEGNPTGICLGYCYVGSNLGEYAPAGIYWKQTPEEYQLDPKGNESEAWIFGITISMILFGIWFYGTNKNERKK